MTLAEMVAQYRSTHPTQAAPQQSLPAPQPTQQVPVQQRPPFQLGNRFSYMAHRLGYPTGLADLYRSRYGMNGTF